MFGVNSFCTLAFNNLMGFWASQLNLSLRLLGWLTLNERAPLGLVIRLFLWNPLHPTAP